jgi:hypothetical protein
MAPCLRRRVAFFGMSDEAIQVLGDELVEELSSDLRGA